MQLRDQHSYAMTPNIFPFGAIHRRLEATKSYLSVAHDLFKVEASKWEALMRIVIGFGAQG